MNMRISPLILALLLPSPGVAALELPKQCKVEASLFDDARQALEAKCASRITELEKKRDDQGCATTAFTALSVTSGIFAAGGAAALTAIPGVASAIEAADANKEPGPDMARWQLGIGVTTALLGGAAAGFGTLAAFKAPSAEEAGALHADLNAARAAANGLALVPIFAADDPREAKKILQEAASKCALSNPKPPPRSDVPATSQSAGTTNKMLGPPAPRCVLSVDHDPKGKVWVGKYTDEGLIILTYKGDSTSAVTEVCLMSDPKECSDDKDAIAAFLKDFPHAQPPKP